MLTCILYSGVAATRKRKAPSSTHSVVNFGDLSPETLARVDKAVKIAEKEAPGIAAETSRRGRERHAEELRKQVCTSCMIHALSIIKYCPKIFFCPHEDDKPEPGRSSA